MNTDFEIGKLRNIALATLLAGGLAVPTGLACAETGASQTEVESSSSASTSSANTGTATSEKEPTKSESSKEESTLVNDLLNQLDAKTNNTASENLPTKDETVFVFADATGSVKNKIVSDWLKNTKNAETLEDVSKLTDINNTEGRETFSQSGNKVVWDAKGADIHYQGTTEMDAPVEVALSYTLDGKAITPENLAGKSGKVTIRFDYTNKSYSMQEIEGKKEKIYTPFVAMSACILDNDVFSNVEATNAKIIGDGDRTTVIGYALPGMQENLNLAKDDINIPSYVEIKADVKDFSLALTATVVSNEFFDDLNGNTLDTSELDSDIDKLSDAMTQLLDGSGQLDSGLQELLDGMNQLNTGVLELQSKTSSLPDSASQLANGSAQLASSLQTAIDAIKQLHSGSSSVTDGLGKASDGLASAQSGANQLASGGTDLASGIASAIYGLNDGNRDNSNDVKDAVLGSKAGVDQVKEGLDTALSSTAAADQLTQIGAGLQGASPELESAGSNIGAAGASVQSAGGNVGTAAGVLQQLLADPDLPAANQALVGQALTELATAGESLGAAGGSLSAAGENLGNAGTNLQSAGAGAQELQSTLEGMQAGLKSASDGLGQVSSGLSKADSGIDQVVSGLWQAQSGAQSLADGATSLASGIGSAKDGVDQLESGSAQIESGLGELEDKLPQAQSGAQAIANGTSQLASSAPSLVEGIGQLADGASQLSNGTQSAADGMTQLTDGLEQFNDEAVSKIVDAYNGDIKGLSSRFHAIVDAGKAYDNFSGKNEKMAGTVKFIYETDPIG